MPRRRRPPPKPTTPPPDDGAANHASPEPPPPPAPPAPPASIPPRSLAEAIAVRIGAARYGLLFHGQTRFILTNNVLYVAVRNQQAQEFYEDRFGADAREAVQEVYGAHVEVNWIVDEQAVNEGLEVASATNGGKTSPESLEASKAPKPIQRDLFGEPVEDKPKPRREREGGPAGRVPGPGRKLKSLSEFIAGPDNRFASAAARSVAETPGAEANPLVLHGPIGTGKTHLLQGIYSELRRKSDQRPVYVTSEDFTNQFTRATQHGKMGAFRRQFRECTALLFDDLHKLATRRQTQQEFLNTFDALLADGRQVVISMDVHPRYAEELLPELVDRLLGGVVCVVLPPDPDTRLEILRAKSAGGSPPIPELVLRYLADNLRGNVRELEGAVNNLRFRAKEERRPIDLALVSLALGELSQHAVRAITVADVDAAVRSTLHLPAGTLQSKSRTLAVTHPRMFAIHLCRKHTAATFGEISKYFGASTHSTAVNADKKVREWVEKNESVVIGDRNWPAKELLSKIERELQK